MANQNQTDLATDVLTKGSFLPEQIDPDILQFGTPQQRTSGGVTYTCVPLTMDLGEGMSAPLNIQTPRILVPRGRINRNLQLDLAKE